MVGLDTPAASASTSMLAPLNPCSANRWCVARRTSRHACAGHGDGCGRIAAPRDTRGLRGPLAQSVEHRTFNPLVRSEEHTSELQSLMRISYAVFCLKKK